MLENDRFLRSIFRQKVDRTPAWIMRQAGRYLPEYRKVREQAGDFLTLCKTPALATQVTLQPIERYPLDAAIIFSDILTIPDAYGLGLNFVEGEGPCFLKPIQDEKAIRALPKIDPETELKYVMDAIRSTKTALANKVPLIGFAGSPWTLACYMVEGKASKQFNNIKRLLYRDPALLKQLLKHLSASVTDYLNAQIAAGVDAVMIFDSWAGLLAPPEFQEFSLPYIQQIIQGVKLLQNQNKKQTKANTISAQIPIIIFCKNGGLQLEEISNLGCDVIGLDWIADLRQARTRVGDKVALQGNLDPAVLYAKPEAIKQAVKQLLQAYGEGSGHIFNLGHGIAPDVEPEQVSVLLEAIHEYSPMYHQTQA